MRKNVELLFVGLISLFMTFSNNINAQCKNKWGETPKDSVACVKNYSLYSTYYKQGNYKDAYPYWQFVYDSCPCVSTNTYIKGVKIYKALYANQFRDSKVSQKYVDTLMMIYDQRVKYFPRDKAKVLSYKAVDLFTYCQRNIEKIIEAHKYMSESINISKNSSTYASLNNFINISISLFQAGKLTDKETFDDYVIANKILEYQIASPHFKKKLKRIQDVKLKNDKLIVSSGVLNCEMLIPYFTPKFKGDDTDNEELKKMVAFLSTANCVDNPLFEKALVVNIKKNPSSQAYQTGANFFQGKNNYSKAVEYYKKAVEYEESDTTKADLYFKICDIYYGKLKDYPSARTYAYKALEYRKNWGWPYIIIGSAYASSSETCGDNKFAQKAVYLVAVDKFIKAKSVDKDPEVQKQAGKLITSNSARFPDNETAFFYGFKDGDSYSVGCWINENTSIRTIKK